MLTLLTILCAAQNVIRNALEAAGVSAWDLDMLSMHGTGA
jgi:3-oxoacyl-(acyl-carrier-protein) synthase